jgi:hypothetical protein
MPAQPLDLPTLVTALMAFIKVIETASAPGPKPAPALDGVSRPETPASDGKSNPAGELALDVSRPRRGRPRVTDGQPQFEPAHPSLTPGPAPPLGKLLTLKELKETYKISRPAAYVLINQGKLERIKIGSRTLITDSSARALMVRA